MIQQRDVVKELKELIPVVGEQKAVEVLNAQRIPIKTIADLVTGKYKHQPRAMLREAMVNAVDALLKSEAS